MQLFIREASKNFNSFSNGGRYIADFVKCPRLNVTAESSSKVKLAVNAYGALLSPMNTMKVINYETSKYQVRFS